MVQALTTSNETEIIECLETLKSATAGTGVMHESFNKDNVQSFTRPWFAWANSLFAGLIFELANKFPKLIFT